MSLAHHIRNLTCCALLACAAPAQEPNGIPAFLKELSQALNRADAKTLEPLFAPDAELRIGRQTAVRGPHEIAVALTTRKVWSEEGPPWITDQSVRVVSADVAFVDAVETRVAGGRTPIFLLLKRTGANWRIVLFRSQ
jgi:hypothetical protein